MSLLVFCLVLCSTVVWGLYEDQLGNVDWYRRGIGGAPYIASLHPRKPRLIATTDGGFLVNLHLRDGTIQWRQKLDHPVDRLFSSNTANTLITLSNEKREIRCWAQADGSLKWERFLDAPSLAALLLDTQMLYLQHPATVTLHDELDGVIWSHELQKTSHPYRIHLFTPYNDETAALISITRDKLRLAMIEIQSGEEQSSQEVDLETHSNAEVTKIDAGIANNHLAIKTDTDRLCILHLSHDVSTPLVLRSECRKESMEVEFIGATIVKVDRTQVLDDICYEYDVFIGVARLEKIGDGGKEGVREISHYVTHSQPIQVQSDIVFAILSHLPGTTEWRFVVYVAMNGTILHEEVFTNLPPGFVPERLFLGSYSRQNASPGFRFFVVATHVNMVMLQQGQVVWERNDVMSGVMSALFVDPPTHGSYVKVDPLKWIYTQFLSVKVQLKLSTPAERVLLAEMRLDLSGKNLVVKDASGYRKIIIALTKYHSVIGIHNGDGRILWQTHFQSHQTFDGMTLWSYSHSEEATSKVLLYKKGDPGLYAIIDAHTGELAHESTETRPFSKIIKMPRASMNEEMEQSIFILVDMTDAEKPTGYVIPCLNLTKIRSDFEKLTLWHDDGESAYGYGVDSVEQSKEQIQFGMRWKVNFHAKILSVSERGYNDPVHSYTKVLGDRSLLFKYLNPNTALVVTGMYGELAHEAVLEAFVIDTVTGRILFRQQHDGARGPVHGVISQHWAAYHYWSTTNDRFQISTIEMYDASHRQLTLSDFVTDAVERQAEFSSFAPISIKTFNSTFFVATGLLLMATASDQIYAMSKRFLDPRRPIRQTSQTKEERLIPYSEMLRLGPTQYVSYNYAILDIRGMVTAPAELESATHLFAFGDDIYYTRVQPERGFDTLEDDFNYGFLILTLAGMFVAAVISHYMVGQAKLQRKWK